MGALFPRSLPLGQLLALGVCHVQVLVLLDRGWRRLGPCASGSAAATLRVLHGLQLGGGGGGGGGGFFFYKKKKRVKKFFFFTNMGIFLKKKYL